MVYGSFQKIKTLLGQTSDAKNDKINKYQLMAYNWINSQLINIETTIPIPTPNRYVIDFEENLAAAFFYHYESGDTIVDKALQDDFIAGYWRNKYNRPKFVTRVY